MLNPISHHILNDPNEDFYTQRGIMTTAADALPLDEIEIFANNDQIWQERGKAIQYYALLEASLCWLMAHTGDIDSKVANILFYKNTSSAARNSILKKLLRKKFGSEFNLFWNSYLDTLRSIDLKRNEIVHWLSVCYSRRSGEGKIDCGVVLVPSGFENLNDNTARITIADLKEFSHKCSVYTLLCRQFIFFTSENVSISMSDSWKDIFVKPLVYPLVAGHPLNAIE